MIERQIGALLLSIVGIIASIVGLWAITMFGAIALHGYVHFGYLLIMVACAIVATLCRYLSDKLTDGI